MNKIEKMIAELCPNGVEFRPLQDVFTTRNGYTPSTSNKSFWENGTIPWFRMEDIRENGQILSDSLQKITPEAVKGGKLFPANSIIIATSATIGEHALITVPHLSNQRFTSLTPKPEFIQRFSMKFVFYYCFALNEWCKSNTTKSSFASVDMAGFKKFPFPIPPLAIQNEIVRILDTMTALTSELTSELNLRKLQYQHYRDSLLNFGTHTDSEASKQAIIATGNRKNATWSTLGDENFVEISNSARKPVKASLRKSGSIPYYGANNIQDYVDGCTHDGTYVLIAEDGSASLESYSIQYAEGKFWANNHVHVVRGKNQLDTRFLYYYLHTVNFMPFLPNKDRAKLTKADMMKIPIPVPSKEEQARIVAILDKFDTLTHSITEGLPREIALRQKQYEHYRDLLLSFPQAI